MSADLNLTVKKLPRSFLNEEISFNKWAGYFVKLNWSKFQPNVKKSHQDVQCSKPH